MKRMVIALTATLIVAALAGGCASSKKTPSTTPSSPSASLAMLDRSGN